MRRPLKDGRSGHEQGLQGRRQPARAARCESPAHSCGRGRLAARARCLPSESVAGATTARLRVGRAGAAPRSCAGVSRTPSSRGATPVPTEGTLKPARACGGRALYVVSRGARIASGVRRCSAPSCGAGAVAKALVLRDDLLLVSYRPLARGSRRSCRLPTGSGRNRARQALKEARRDVLSSLSASSSSV